MSSLIMQQTKVAGNQLVRLVTQMESALGYQAEVVNEEFLEDRVITNWCISAFLLGVMEVG